MSSLPSAPAVITRFKNHRFTLILMGCYLLFLLTLPRIIMATTPCLKPNATGSFQSRQCLATPALDSFITYGLIGALVANLIWLKQNGFYLKAFFPFIILISLLLVGSYYLYIPRLFQQFDAANIMLPAPSP